MLIGHTSALHVYKFGVKDGCYLNQSITDIILFFSYQIGLAIAIRYSLSRRAFSITPNGPEVLLLDYPSHQRRLLPLLAKT